MPFAALNGFRAYKGAITIPLVGPWEADLYLHDAETLTEPVTLTIGDLAMLCSVVRSAEYTGGRSARVVGGYGGWRKVIPARAYTHEAGLLASLVIGDAAKEAGEKVLLTTDFAVGLYYVRAQAKAIRVLDHFIQAWWVRPDGVTVLSPRPISTVTVPIQSLSFSGAAGRIELGADDYAQIVPNAQVTTPTIGTRTISAVTHRIEQGAIHTELLVA